jgi:hypothetical protein
MSTIHAHLPFIVSSHKELSVTAHRLGVLFLLHSFLNFGFPGFIDLMSNEDRGPQAPLRG